MKLLTQFLRDWKSRKKIIRRNKSIHSTNSLHISIKTANVWKKRDVMERTPPKKVIEINLSIINYEKPPLPIAYSDFAAFDKLGNQINHYVYAPNLLGTILEPNSKLEASIFLIADFKEVVELTYREPNYGGCSDGL